MKRKTLTLTLSILACLALIGVGFASWVISAGKSATATGNIVVDDVSDKRISLTYEWVDGKSSIIYGWDENYVTKEKDWLKNNTVDKKADLDLTLKVTVKDGNNNLYDPESISATITADEAYTTALGKGVVGALPTLTAVEESTGVYNIVIVFTWGEHFGGNNPLAFYNEGTKTAETHGEDAKEYLGYVEALKDCTFTVTIDAK